MKIILYIVIASCIFAGCSKQQTGSKPGDANSNFTFASPSPTAVPGKLAPLESLSDAVKRQIAAKYNKKASDVSITVSQEQPGHAKGMVSFVGEQGGAIWFAALEKGGWILVDDGQGPVSCDKANEYAFPNTLIPECLQNNKIIKR